MAFTSVNESNLDFDNLYVTDQWLVDKFVGYKMFACGYNFYGQIAQQTQLRWSTPTQVGTLLNWVSIGTISQAAFGIKTDGTLWGWGQNTTGQLGNNTSSGIAQSSPIQIGSLTNWASISRGSNGHVTAIKNDGTLWAWGSNAAGDFGNGNTTSTSSPVQVGTATNWKQTDAGNGHSATITTDGHLFTCGYNNLGQLGDGSTALAKSSQIQIGTLTNWKQVSCGATSTAAVKTDGTLWTWGNNGYGQLGLGTFGAGNHKSSPTQVGTGTTWKQVSATWDHTAAVKYDGTLWVWGRNTWGVLGDGTTNHVSSPVQVGSMTNWKSVSCGYGFFMALKTDGTVWGCGKNDYGNLGDASISHRSSPVQTGTATNWKIVTAGLYDSWLVTLSD
jgi:alpha-tubulin suppressor-like RCC1 family protein